MLFIQDDASTCLFKEQFDLVVSFCALHWIKDQKKVLYTIYENLLEGGKAILVLPASSPTSLSLVCSKLTQNQKWHPYFPCFEPQRVYFNQDEYAVLLEEAGLTPLSITVTPVYNDYPNKAAFVEWLRPLTTFTHHLSEALQEEFLLDLADAMLEKDPSHTGEGVRLPSLKMEVLAQK